ncbi:MAG: Neutral ceramidase [Candidatus Anoxychlamydiales bacterium]|nr:Neutral ceramidase [Candidatus Anoxychlamydiales bacterium]
MRFTKILTAFFTFTIFYLFADIQVGIANIDITPEISMPSAGYHARLDNKMQGIHDPLYASAMVIYNGRKAIALCSIDNLGFDYSMTQEIIKKVSSECRVLEGNIFIGSSHTHSGAGSYLNFPIIGEIIAGKFDSSFRENLIEKTADVIIQAFKELKDAKIGIGYGDIQDLNEYRGKVPTTIEPRKTITIIKVTDLSDNVIGVFYNFALHPTLLPHENMLFSADFIGATRNYLKETFSDDLISIYFNGAQGDVIPNSKYLYQDNYFESLDLFAKKLSAKIIDISSKITTKDELDIDVKNFPYEFDVKPTSIGLKIPIEKYKTEMNLITLDKKHAFLTIPAELSCIYDYELRKEAKKKFLDLSILGLTNDAHGHIMPIEAWDLKSFETQISFGGREYGPFVKDIALDLINR